MSESRINDVTVNPMNSQRVTEHSARLDLMNVSYNVTVGKVVKRLLKDINLRINGGDMCAVMGPSGAGKSVLMELIANRKTVGQWTGDILVNGIARDRSFNHISAFVLQEDLHIANLTVEETVRYAAWTRIPDSMSPEDREKRVQFLLEMLGIQHVKKSVVGNAMLKGISGGQKKRLSVAVEIVNLPNYLFLDEPTTGLDSSIAYEVIDKVRQLVDHSRVCLVTIHQPSPEVFALFNRAVLVHAGRVIYSGPTDKVFSHFNALGYSHKPSTNPAEFIISICNDPANTPEELQALFTASDLYQPPSVYDENDAAAEAEADGHVMSMHFEGENSSISRQFTMLLSRGWNQSVRDVASLKAELVKHLFFAFVIGGAFFQKLRFSYPYDQNNVDDFTGVIFFTTMFFWYSNTQSIPNLAAMDQLYRRELAASAYSPLPYWAATIITKIPSLLLFFTIFFLIWFFMCGFRINIEYFVFAYAVLFIGSLSSLFYSLLFAAASGNAVIAFAIVPPLSVFMGMFSGYPIYIRDIPTGWRWGAFVSSWRWVFQAFVMNEFKEEENAQGDPLGDVSKLYFEDDNLPSGFTEYWAILVLLLYMNVVSLLMYLGMRKAKSKLVKITPPSGEELEVNLLRASMAFASGADATAVKRKVINRKSILSRKSVLSEKRKSGIIISEKRSSEMRKFGDHRTSRFEEGNFRSSVITSKVVDDEMLMHESVVKQMQTSMLGKMLVSTEKVVVEDIGLTQATNYNVDDFRQSVMRFSVVNNYIKDEDDNSASKGIRLDFTDLNYTVVRPSDGAVLELLKDINGTIPGGQMCALMGASGAGKSTLLDVLAARKNVGTITGKILFDGIERNSALSRNIAYVMQDDLHIPNLTVKETLYFAAELRMDESESNQAKLDRVNTVINMLLLSDVENSIVGGGVIRGLPGGKRRRVSIGVEIVNFPGLIFLDEPTSGLDSSASNEVCSAVRALADDDRTIVCTIHQPSATAFENFDMLVLLAAGKVIYFGDAKKAVSFFTNSIFGFSYNETQNPADFVIAVAGGFVPSKSGTSITGDELVSYYIDTSRGSTVAPFQKKVSNTASETLGEYPTSFLKQFMVMFKRQGLKTWRNQLPLKISIFRCILAATLFGSITSGMPGGDSDEAYKSRKSFAFFSMFYNTVVQIQTISMYFDNRSLYNRERGAKIYSGLSYWLAVWLVWFIFLIFHTLVFCIVAYPWSGFQRSGGAFFFFYAITLLSSFVTYFLAQFISASCPNAQTAMGIYPMLFLPSTLFCGYYQNLPDIIDWLKYWFPYVLSIHRWCFQGMVLNEIVGNSELDMVDERIKDLGFDTVSAGGCFGVLLLFLVFFNSLTCYSLLNVNYEKR